MRILPILVFAIAALATLKGFGLLFRGGYVFADDAQEIGERIGIPRKLTEVHDPITGQVILIDEADFTGVVEKEEENKKSDSEPENLTSENAGSLDPDSERPAGTGRPEPPATAAVAPNPKEPAGRLIQSGSEQMEAQLIQRLAERRELNEQREKDLEFRERLISAVEKRVTERIEELSALEKRIQTKLDAHASEAEEKVKSLARMYETMRSKNAAKIFEEMESDVLVPLAREISTKVMAEILSKMVPAAARALTTALARPNSLELSAIRQNRASTPEITDLPKIDGDSLKSRPAKAR